MVTYLLVDFVKGPRKERTTRDSNEEGLVILERELAGAVDT